MGYQGVKFLTKIIREESPNDPRLNRLKYWCNIFHKKNFAPSYSTGSYGNLSFRLNKGKNQFIITASHVDLNKCKRNDHFVTVLDVDLESKVVYTLGSRNPSSESMLHYAIYNQREDVQAIFHGHCYEISKNAKRLNIPITSKEEPYGTLALVNSVLESLNDFYFLEMRNHGFVSLGKSLDEAGNLALKVLEECQHTRN